MPSGRTLHSIAEGGRWPQAREARRERGVPAYHFRSVPSAFPMAVAVASAISAEVHEPHPDSHHPALRGTRAPEDPEDVLGLRGQLETDYRIVEARRVLAHRGTRRDRDASQEDD